MRAVWRHCGDEVLLRLLILCQLVCCCDTVYQTLTTGEWVAHRLNLLYLHALALCIEGSYVLKAAIIIGLKVAVCTLQSLVLNTRNVPLCGGLLHAID